MIKNKSKNVAFVFLALLILIVPCMIVFVGCGEESNTPPPAAVIELTEEQIVAKIQESLQNTVDYDGSYYKKTEDVLYDTDNHTWYMNCRWEDEVIKTDSVIITEQCNNSPYGNTKSYDIFSEGSLTLLEVVIDSMDQDLLDDVIAAENVNAFKTAMKAFVEGYNGSSIPTDFTIDIDSDSGVYSFTITWTDVVETVNKDYTVIFNFDDDSIIFGGCYCLSSGGVEDDFNSYKWENTYSTSTSEDGLVATFIEYCEYTFTGYRSTVTSANETSTGTWTLAVSDGVLTVDSPETESTEYTLGDRTFNSDATVYVYKLMDGDTEAGELILTSNYLLLKVGQSSTYANFTF